MSAVGIGVNNSLTLALSVTGSLLYMSLSATDHSSSPSFRVPSPPTSDGNQVAYYHKYGRWPPAGPDSTAAVHARALELLGSPTTQQEKVSGWQ